jgi:hypothetical protein
MPAAQEHPDHVVEELPALPVTGQEALAATAMSARTRIEERIMVLGKISPDCFFEAAGLKV